MRSAVEGCDGTLRLCPEE